MARTGRNGNIGFIKETTWGSYLTSTTYLRAASENLVNTIDNIEDPALVSEVYTTALVKNIHCILKKITLKELLCMGYMMMRNSNSIRKKLLMSLYL